MPDVNPTSAICHFTFYLSSLILPVQSHLVSFGINEESHVSYFGRNLGFWHHHFTTRFFDTVNNRLDVWVCIQINNSTCLLYTSDAADDLLCVDLGGRRIIK